MTDANPVLRRFKVERISAQGDVDGIRKCLVAGYFCNAARLQLDGTYRTIKDNQPLAIHPSSVLYAEDPPKYVIYGEVVLTSQNYMRDVTAIIPEWLSEIAPHFYQFAPTLPNLTDQDDMFEIKRSKY